MPGLAVTSASRTRLDGYVQEPVHQRVDESQLAPRVSVILGVSRLF